MGKIKKTIALLLALIIAIPLQACNTTFTVKFDPDGGKAVSDITLKSGEVIKERPETTKTGYTLEGWYDKDGGRKVVFPYTLTKNKEFLAKWDAVAYSITYNLNNGTFGSAVPASSYNIESAAVTLPPPGRNGYAFIGWYDNAGLGGAAVTQIAAGSTGNKEFWAKWNASSYSITYHLNGGTGAADGSYTVENTPVTLGTPSRNGYAFGGWYDNAGFAGAAVTQIPANDTGNREYWAKWNINSYSVTYHLNGGAGVSNGTYTIESAAVTLGTPSRNGYAFGGWYGNAALSGAAVTQIVAGSTGNKEFWAKWNADLYTVTYHLNGGAGVSNDTYTIESAAVTLGTPVKNGYTFGGWYANAELSGAEVTQIPAGSTGNKEFWAKWSVKSYSIKYNLNGGDGVTDGTYTIESAAITLGTPVKNGYTFGGWYGNAGLSGAAVMQISAGSTGDKEFWAKWNADGYTITYHLNEGTGVANGSYTVEDTPFILPLPDLRTGYNFAGWYDNVGLGGAAFTQIAADSTGNKEFWAKWTAVSYTVTYNLNGGEGVPNGTYTIESPAVTLPAPSRSGYSFGGWFDNQALSGAGVAQIPEGSTGNKEFWAKWNEIIESNTITYYLNGGSLPTGAKEGYDNGEAFALPVPSRTGYDFMGWFDNVNLSGTAVTEITAADTGDKTFWAKWTAVTYTITYNPDGGTGAPNGTYTIESAAITLPAPDKNGYTFGGWYNNPGLTGTAVTQISAGSIGNREYWAKWTARTYTVTYNANGGTGAPNGTYTIESAAVTLPQPAKNNYTFAGWYDNAGLTGAAVTEIPAGSTGNKTFWAKWTATPYTITYDPNGGTGVSNGTYTVESATVTLPSPNKNGYTFAGWHDNAGLTGTAVTSIPAGSSGNKEFWAKWTAVNYSITYNSNGGTGAQNGTYTIESTTVTLPTSVKNGYTFIGWYDNAGLTGTPVTQIPAGSTGNKAFWAKWAVVTFNIAYNLNGGTGVSDGTYTVESQTITLPAPSKEGYRFAGWYDNAEFNGAAVSQIGAGSTGDKIFWAKWAEPGITVTYKYNLAGRGDYKVSTLDPDGGYEAAPEPFIENGYYFGAWYKDAACTPANLFDFGTKITQSLTLYAKPLTGDIFEAEYVLLEWEDDDGEIYQRVGSGYSGPCQGYKMIYEDIERPYWIDPVTQAYKTAGASGATDAHGAHYITGLYAGNSFIDFEIYYSGTAAIEDAALYARLTAEFYDMCIAPTNRTVGGINYYSFLFEVIHLGATPYDPVHNPSDPRLNFGHPSYVSTVLDYKPIALTSITNSPGDAITDFEDYLINARVKLMPGWNVIRLRTNNNFAPLESGTIYSIAPMVDCIKVYAGAALTMKKYEDNVYMGIGA